MLKDLVLKTRSYRRFHNSKRIPTESLLALIDLARQTASGRNQQALKYYIYNRVEDCNTIFPHLSWAAALSDWDGPTPEEQPSAYIIVCRDNLISKNHYCDDGIAIQTILLGATELGLGGCIMGAFNSTKLSSSLNIKEHLSPLYVLALGHPNETIQLDESKDGSLTYYRDEKSVHHVPKRSLDEIIVNY